jgi:hypothetical protein
MDDVTKPKLELPPARMLEVHPLAQLIPEASPEEFKTLKHSIRVNRIREPIWLFEGKILDGRHRVRAGLELHYDFKPTDFRVFEGTHEQAKAFVEDVNLARRQLTKEQKEKVALRMIAENPKASNREIARKCGLSHVTVGKLKQKPDDKDEKDFEKFVRDWQSLNDQQQERFAGQFKADLQEILREV